MDMKISTEEGFVDVALPVKKVEALGSERIIELAGIHEGKNVEIKIVVPTDMKAGVRLDGNEFKIVNIYKGTLVSCGEATDAFIKTLAGLYQVPTPSHFSGSPVGFSMLPMEDKDFDIEKQAVKTKLFFELPEKYYCELFLNFDIANGYVQFSEKDQEYRENLLSMMEGKS